MHDWYVDSFRDLRLFPDIKNKNNELEFTQMIKMIKVRHNNVVPMMAMGVQQLKKGMDPKIVDEDLVEIHQFLDRFYMSRIGIRMLIGLSFIFWSFYSFLLSLLSYFLISFSSPLLSQMAPFNSAKFFWLNSGQHVALHDPNPPPDRIGYIHTKMSPVEVARDACEDARAVCMRHYGSAPEIDIYGDPNFTFP